MKIEQPISVDELKELVNADTTSAVVEEGVIKQLRLELPGGVFIRLVAEYGGIKVYG